MIINYSFSSRSFTWVGLFALISVKDNDESWLKGTPLNGGYSIKSNQTVTNFTMKFFYHNSLAEHPLPEEEKHLLKPWS